MVAAHAVLGREPIVVRPAHVQCGGDRLLQRRGCADGHKVMHLPYRGGELRGGHDPADPPSGHRERLARARDRHGPLGHPLQRRDRDVLAFVADVLVDLVGDRDDVVLAAEPRDRFELGPGEHTACRIVRCVDDDGLRARAERAGELVRVEFEGGRPKRHEDRRRARDRGVRPVVLVERLEHDHLVARVADSEERGDHRLRRSAGHCQHRLWVDPHRIELAVRARERVAKALRTPRDRVLVDVRVDGSFCGVLHLRRRGKVREALRQVDPAVHRGEPRHLADDRFGETDRPPRNALSRETH